MITVLTDLLWTNAILNLHTDMVGGFDALGASEGVMGWFNVWDYQMKGDAIATISLSTEGNVVKWDERTASGQPVFTHISFPAFHVKVGLPGNLNLFTVMRASFITELNRSYLALSCGLSFIKSKNQLASAIFVEIHC